MFSELFLWSSTVLLCTTILLVQVVTLMRPLLFTRQPLWKYALVVLALLLSLSSFVVAIHATQYEQSLFILTKLHMNPTVYMHLKAQLSSAFVSCVVQTCLLVSMIVLLLGIKRTLHSRYVPVWVLAQDIHLYLCH